MGKFSVTLAFDTCDLCQGPMAKGDKVTHVPPEILREIDGHSNPNEICEECRKYFVVQSTSRKGCNAKKSDDRRMQLAESLKSPDYMDNPDIGDDWSI